MTTFLIQTIEGEVKHDFAFHLKEAVRSQNWFYNQELYKVIESPEPNVPNCIPVGSLEFVFEYLEKYHQIPKNSITPINIPPELFQEKYLQRKCEILSKEDIKVSRPTFVKSALQYKSFTQFVEKEEDIPEGVYLVSEEVEIESEWRTFVFQGEIVGLQHYSGECTLFPNVEPIRSMIKEYKDCPPAYTLDVGVNEKGTFLIEVHPFVSCGLYGFNHQKFLPIMFISAFNYLIREQKKKHGC